MNINRLHRAVPPILIGYGQSASHINEHFISIIPGDELTECIEAVVEYCKVNNTSATLEFNGYANKIESWIDPKDLSTSWYSHPTDFWYDARRVKMRDNKIDTILNG